MPPISIDPLIAVAVVFATACTDAVYVRSEAEAAAGGNLEQHLVHALLLRGH